MGDILRLLAIALIRVIPHKAVVEVSRTGKV